MNRRLFTRRASFGEGVLLALALAVAASVLVAVLPAILGAGIALKLTVTLLGGAYVAYLLRRSSRRTGRLVTGVLWLAATVLGWAGLDLGTFALSQIGLVSLVRALYFHAGPLAAFADLGLSAFALAAGAWAFATGSWLLAVWTFFLVQAVFVWIPGARERGTTPETDPDDEFDTARELARRALTRLATDR